MRRCIVHFGLHKTGTTSIQRFLRNELSDPRFFYPDPPPELQRRDDCHNRILCAAFMAHPEKYHSHVRAGALPEELRARGEAFKGSLAKRLREVPEQTTILSAEELSNFDTEELRLMADFLRQQELDVTYIGYVRKYKSLQESRFQEALRQGRPRGGVLHPDDPRFTNFPYRSRIAKFMMLAGKDAVDLRKFDRATLKDGCVVRDFCSRTGIEGAVAENPDANAGISFEACKLLYTYRKFGTPASVGTDPNRECGQLVEMLRELKSDRLVFHSSLLLASQAQWRADVEWISNEMGEDMTGDIFADDERPCVRAESDLFHYASQTLEWLANKSGVSLTKLHRGDARVVYDAVETVRQKALHVHASSTQHSA